MTERKYIKDSITLCGESDGKKFNRTFNIHKTIDSGSTVVCYEASYKDSSVGILREFYPRDAFVLERTESGQLVYSEGLDDAKERFDKEKAEYIEPYMMLLNAKRESHESELTTFIPVFEIYRGCDDEGKSAASVYIWSPTPPLVTFDSICEEIHAQPDVHSEHKLITVLTAIESLTKCICALHDAEMVHRDIKPSNFGFIKRADETLTQTISMFDIDSICSIYNQPSSIMGTPGYMEPEYRDGRRLSVQTDIYSIGATLFRAIVVSGDETAPEYYKDEYYDKLYELVSSSALIRTSDSNSNPEFLSILVTILKKSLCKRTERYPRCEDLLSDLESALYLALPSHIARKNIRGKQWVLTDANKFISKTQERKASLAMQYHLYRHPLYKAAGDDPRLSILLIGLGKYGKKFLDISLQAGQMPGRKLDITVVSGSESDKKDYLSKRPGLQSFFSIDGSPEDGSDTYGSITFKTAELAASYIEIFRQCAPHYVFIALDDDESNLSAARLLGYTAAEHKTDCLISYVSENSYSPLKEGETLLPVYVSSDIKKDELHGEVERMAFNAHLIWEKDLNTDRKKIKATFADKYYHDSCVSHVLSLKYKLYSIGIDLDRMTFDEAAAAFVERGLDKNDGCEHMDQRNELICTEHRRWVTEKLCSGWTRLLPEECIDGVTSDKKQKRHVCLVRSEPNQNLTRIEHERWRSASDGEIKDLDELDRTSLELHRLYLKRAEAVKNNNLLNGNTIAAIRMLTQGEKRSRIAFGEWFSCVRDIAAQDTRKVRLYETLKAVLLDSVKGTLNQRSVEEQVDAFDVMFRPIKASMEYRDYKQEDVSLIDNIPFVLTYTDDSYMVIPFVISENNTSVFGNVSAVTVVNPAHILYLCLIEQNKDVRTLKSNIQYVLEYMNKKQLQSSVEFVIAHIDFPAITSKLKSMTAEIKALDPSRVKRVKLITYTDDKKLLSELSAYLEKRSAGKHMFTAEKNYTGLSYLMRGAGLYDSIPNYRFNSLNMIFSMLNNCDMLRYIKKRPYISVTDMAAFKLSSSESSDQPEFYDDYERLWNRYKNQKKVWKALCTALRTYSEKHDVICVIKEKLNHEKAVKDSEYGYTVPSQCFGGAKKIVEYLIKRDIIGEKSSVAAHGADSCRITVFDRSGNKAKYDELFSNHYLLMMPDSISFNTNYVSRDTKIIFDSLTAAGVPIAGDLRDDMIDLLEFFSDMQYISSLTVSGDTVSFTYAARNVKSLMTLEGRMLEVYTFHKVKELGEFDDVVSSFEIDWENTDVKNELDCIVTKGFRSVFVECKARRNIDKEFYFKLASLRDRFGINATAVLIADTDEHYYKSHIAENTIQRERGSMMDIITIWKPEEINDIGQTLLKIINGQYQTKP